MSVHSRERAWAFVKERWDEMEFLCPSQIGLQRPCEGIIGLATPELEGDFENSSRGGPCHSREDPGAVRGTAPDRRRVSEA